MKNLRRIAALVALLGVASCTTEATPPPNGSSGPAVSDSSAPRAAPASFKIDGMT